MEWKGGDVAGHLPFSRMQASPGETRIQEPTEVLELLRERFPELIRECQELTAIFVHVMVDRARTFRASDLHDEKLSSLGRLAAGLAHELNNPASAVASNAATLKERLPALESAFRGLGRVLLSDEERALFLELRGRCLADREGGTSSPLEASDRVEALGDWLERRGLERAEAEPLAETAVTIELLDRAAGMLTPEKLKAVLAALAAGCATRQLALDIESAATRVHELVAAVKGFTYMDQATTPKPVDVARGLGDTIAVLRSKAKSKSVKLVAEIEPGLPSVLGLGGELNQVWANLLANAIEASPSGAVVTVGAARRDGSVVVRIVDDGPGIPADLRHRIFEPFFTTKPVGEGTGLGLAITRNLVTQHSGEIEVDSRPGRTEFRVVLPLSDAAAKP
jgi:signal transduction histidine kinase